MRATAVALATAVLTLVAPAAPALARDGDGDDDDLDDEEDEEDDGSPDLPGLSIYGFLRLDTAVDTGRLSDPAAPRYVLAQPDGAGGDSELVMHARLSRLGLQVDRWHLSSDVSGDGQVELDFLGGDHGVRLRHAWAALHTSRTTEVLIGQTWDLISPLYPLASPATLLWDAGNTGGFRPQLRLTALPGQREQIRIAVAVAGAGGPDGTTGPDVDGDLRADSVAGGLPMAQFLIEIRGRDRRREPARAGVWGHVGRDQLASGRRIASYSMGAHVYLPIGRTGALLGEVTHGQNLAAIGGGLGQGINPVRLEAIRSTSGWAEGTATVGKKVIIAEGVAFDTVPSDDVEVGARLRNLVGYLVVKVRPYPSLEAGLETSYWLTTYKGDPGADDDPIGRAVRINLHAGVLF